MGKRQSAVPYREDSVTHNEPLTYYKGNGGVKRFGHTSGGPSDSGVLALLQQTGDTDPVEY